MSWLPRRVLGAALWLLTLLPGPVFAHAVLTEARPADGERLDQAPAELLLRFSEPVIPISVRLLDAQAAEVPGMSLELRGETLILRPAGSLQQGAYLLSYRVTSLDGHPVGAAIRFGIGVAAQAGAPADEGAPHWASVAARWLTYGTALVATGLALFIAIVRPPAPVQLRSRALLTMLAAGGIAAVLLRFGMAGLELAGLPLPAFATAAPWSAAATTTQAPAAATCAFGLMLLALGGWQGTAWLLVPGALAVAASFALAGHAAAAQPTWLTRPALALHVLCASFWLGSLLPLFWSLRLPANEAQAILRRFSAVAMAAIGALVAAGGLLAWVQLGGRVAALWDTAYGLRLAAKLALVAALLLLAALNRFVLTPRIAQSTARRWLHRSLTVDLALGGAVLAVTATFALGPPPRAMLPTATPVTVATFTDGRQALLTLSPGRPGSNRLEAWVTDEGGNPVVAREARLGLALPEAGIEPSRMAMTMPQPGSYMADGLLVIRSGRWRVRLDLLIDDFTRLTFQADLVVLAE